MENAKPASKRPLSKQKLVVIFAVIIAVVLVGLIALRLSAPKRSVASFCKVYAQEDAKLAGAKGDTYGVAVFPGRKSSEPGDFVNAFARLEKVAPDDIRPDVTTLKQVFQKIDADPSQAMGASLSGLGAEGSAGKWVDTSCKASE